MTIDPKALDRLLAAAEAIGEARALPGLANLASAFRQPEGDPRLRVAFVGEFGSGKSQAINSLLGQEILPTGTVPTTRILTEITYGPEARATLVTRDRLEQPVRPEALRDIESSEEYDRARLSLPVDWLREFVLVDTPGLGEPDAAGAELIYEELPRAAVIVFVLNAQAALKQTERRFLEDRILAADLRKVVFLLNQVDRVPADEVGDLAVYAGRQLAGMTHLPVVLPYSAIEALRGRLGDDQAQLERANYPAVREALITGLAADRARLHQAHALASLGESIAASRAEFEARRQLAAATLADLDEQLKRLEGDRARFLRRVELVCERAVSHLDLIRRQIESQVQALRLRVDRDLPQLVDGADPAQLRKHLPFYLEHLVKGYLEWQRPALEAELADLYQEIDRELSEVVAGSLKDLDLQPGYLAPALVTRPANYDRLTQASRVLGVGGLIALLPPIQELPIAGAMLAASQVLRLAGRSHRIVAERDQMVDAGRRAMRACLERARDDLTARMADYRDRVVATIRTEAEGRIDAIRVDLEQARAARATAGDEASGAELKWEAAGRELDRLDQQIARYATALAEPERQPAQPAAPGAEARPRSRRRAAG